MLFHLKHLLIRLIKKMINQLPRLKSQPVIQFLLLKKLPIKMVGLTDGIKENYMKRITLIILICITVICFASCKRSTEAMEHTNLNKGFNTTTETTKIETTKNDKITHKDIEKVYINYLDVKEEYTEDTQNFDFIDNIKNCKDIPKVTIGEEIGSIQIKYVNKEKAIMFATLYLGGNGSIYAKYINSKNDKYAYKLR